MRRDPARCYHDMAQEIQEGHLRGAALMLADHVGQDQAIDLEALADRVLGGKRSDRRTRKMRIILQRLIVEEGYPVCSNSGQPGRWLPASREEAIRSAREREARAEKLLASARRLRAAKLPATLPAENKITQGGLF